MRNALKMLETANQNTIPYTRESLGMEPQIFEEIARRCRFEPILIDSNEGEKIRLKKRGIPIVMLYDKEESCEFKYLDIADIHVGHPDCSLTRLNSVLAKNYNNGHPKVDYVFIAGDLFEGIMDDAYSYRLIFNNTTLRNQLIKKRNEDVRQLTDVLSRYDFDYRIINGNHEYSLVQLGIESPNALLERYMKQRGKRLTYYDTYIVDFVIAGVIKRMMHLEKYDVERNEIMAYERLRKFSMHGGLSQQYGDKKYTIRMLQCGHIHKKMELYDSENRVFISQSGSFIATETSDIPAITVRGRVVEDDLILRL